jgi:hypothetical protein
MGCGTGAGAGAATAVATSAHTGKAKRTTAMTHRISIYPNAECFGNKLCDDFCLTGYLTSAIDGMFTREHSDLNCKQGEGRESKVEVKREFGLVACWGDQGTF